MSNYIVLVKQVPDITQITDNAFDSETGTLIRSRLTSVINELDAQALAFANQIRKENPGNKGRIVCLSMGPPMAEDVLRYALARCADHAVLLTDKSLSGADTPATANPLAFAVRKIVREMFQNDQNYYVICGMQSVDGDTAQVPPQIAEELNIPCIAYVTDAEFKNGRLQFSRIIKGGTQVVAAKTLPVVITVAKYEYPLFATFAASRNAQKTKIVHWNANDINATQIGIKGSKTRVIRVFPPDKTARKCRRLDNVKAFAKTLIESFKNTASSTNTQNARQLKPYILPAKRKNKFDRSFEVTEKENQDFKTLADILSKLGLSNVDTIDEYTKNKILAESESRFHKRTLEDMLNGLKLNQPSFHGEVWVVAEQDNGRLHPATFELIGKSRQLADSLLTHVAVCLAGYNLQPMTKQLIAAGADKIYTIDDELLKLFDPTAHRKVVADAINKYQPQIVLFAATPQGRMLAPMVAYRLGCGLTADCTSLDIRDSSRMGKIAILVQTRPALGGNVMATIYTKNSKSQMATARPGVMKPLTPDNTRTGQIIQHKVRISQDDLSLEIISTQRSTSLVNFDVDIIVSGGKGMQNRNNYQRLVGTLCQSLAAKFNVPLEKGASRAAVELGFAQRAHQVGQTGTAVRPKLYIALGISGAIQHMIGLANTGTILAVNNDPNAPIFKQCDYYIVGNVEDIIPQLVNELEVQTDRANQ